MRVIVFSVLFGVTLFSFPFGYPIYIGDVALITWVIVSLIYSGNVSTSPIAFFSFLWYFLTFISGLFISAGIVSHALDFSVSDFFVSITRATLGAGIVVTTKPLIKKVGLRWFINSLIYIIRFHAILVVVGAFAYKILNVDLGLRIIITTSGSVRSSGLFAEPAWFGWFIGAALFAVSSYQNIVNKNFFKWYDAVVFLLAAFWAAKSFTAIIFITGGLLASYFSNKRIWFLVVPSILIIISLSSLIYISVSPKISTDSVNNTSYIERRLVGIVTGEDLSSVTRYYGTVVRTQYVLDKSPLIGSGIGNNVKAVKGDLFSDIPVVREGSNFHMLPFTALAATGLLGGTAYLIVLLLTLKRKSEWLGLGILLLSLSFGGYLLGVIWWFIGLADTLQSTEPIR